METNERGCADHEIDEAACTTSLAHICPDAYTMGREDGQDGHQASTRAGKVHECMAWYGLEIGKERMAKIVLLSSSLSISCVLVPIQYIWSEGTDIDAGGLPTAS